MPARQSKNAVSGHGNSHPFTPEQIREWTSFGPKLKGKPETEEEVRAAQERKRKTTDFKKRLAKQLQEEKEGSGDGGGDWSEKKIEKELDKLSLEMAATNNDTTAAATTERPSYLDGPSGTRDFYPPEMKVRNWLFEQFRETARLFGFEEYDCPVLERVELYERKAGEEITDQMYNFEDKEGARVTLRPEMTPSLARMVLNKTNLQTGQVRLELPLKWCSVPQCWRFETTQRGRKREHYQWNMDIVGVEHVNAEVELLAAACCFFERVGLDSSLVGIKVNSRAVLESIVTRYVDVALFAQTCIVIDKLDKIGPVAVTEQLAAIGIDELAASEILKALEADSIDQLAEQLRRQEEETGGNGTATPPRAVQDVKRLFELAQDYGFADYLVFDASVVRGLAYYTGIVWEAFDRRGELRDIMGGGRYDRLLELYGGPNCPIPCVGFGFGDCVIMELLKEQNKIPEFVGTGVDYVVCAYSPDLYGAAASVSAKLRACGWSVDLMPTPKKKVANSFKHADVNGAKRMVFVAPNEIENGVVRVKDLRTKDKNGEAVQVDVPLDAIHTVDELMAAEAAK